MKRTLPFLLLLLSCAPGKEKDGVSDSLRVARTPVEQPNGEKVVHSYYSGGKVKSEITYKNGKKNGVARSFDRDGSLVLELNYVDDKREGMSKKYFAGGKILAQTTEYRNDKMNGVQIKYRGNGKLLSEAPYQNDFPCLGLKEYLENEALKKKYPSIEIKVEDNIQSTGSYEIKLSLSEKVRRVRFYEGKLSPNGCITDDDNRLKYLLQDESTKTGEISWDIPPGTFMMQELNFIAAFETLMGNTAIVQRKYHLAIDNK
jgi:hypothetical protein